jgi:hypothetical protein
LYLNYRNNHGMAVKAASGISSKAPPPRNPACRRETWEKWKGKSERSGYFNARIEKPRSL